MRDPRRREFITLLGGTRLRGARGARAGQRPHVPAWLPAPLVEARSGGCVLRRVAAQWLRRGKKPRCHAGGFEATDDNLAERAAALVNAAPDAIVAGPAPPLRALQAITRTIPLIGMSEDMVGEGLVASLARPDANITGISLLSPELDGKRQEILIEAVPGARRIAAMADSRQTPSYHLQTLQHAARSRGV